MPATTLDARTALVVIDLQSGLSKFPTLVPFARIVEKNVELAGAFRRAGLPVVLVTAGFAVDFADQLATRTETPSRRVVMEPCFADPLPELGPVAGDILITKRQWGAFYGTELDLQLRRRAITGIVLTGVATSKGVESTARAAHEHGYNLTFATDAITDVDPTDHDHTMNRVFPRLGERDTTNAILALLGR